MLFVDTQPLHALLHAAAGDARRGRARQAALRRSEARVRRSSRCCRDSPRRSIPSSSRFPRSGERTPAKDNVDAIAGLAKIAGFLREEDRDPNFESYAGKSFGGTLELAVFGRVRNETDRRVELARHRLAQYAAPGGPWEVKDVSSTGFKLIAPAASAGTFAIGTLVAIRPSGKKEWTLGVVRRLQAAHGRSHRGRLPARSRARSPASTWSSSGAAPETDYSVDGDGGMISGRSFVALFLVLRKRDGTPAAQSLMLPVSEYHAGQAPHARDVEGHLPRRAGRRDRAATRLGVDRRRGAGARRAALRPPPAARSASLPPGRPKGCLLPLWGQRTQ